MRIWLETERNEHGQQFQRITWLQSYQCAEESPRSGKGRREGGGKEENGLFDCKGRENGRGRLSVSSSR